MIYRHCQLIPEYVQLIKDSGYKHVVINKTKLTVHTINRCMVFQTIEELNRYMSDHTLFTNNQIIRRNK